jgi:hypothetical protein
MDAAQRRLELVEQIRSGTARAPPAVKEKAL